MEALNKKNVQETVTKKEKIILESLSAWVNELESIWLDYEDQIVSLTKALEEKKALIN